MVITICPECLHNIGKWIELEEIKQFFQKYHCYVTVFIALVNIVWFGYMFVNGYLATNQGMLDCGAMLSNVLEEGNYLQLITSVFVHFDIKHLGNNMLLLIVLGAMLESYMGSIRFLIIYILSGLGGNIMSALWHMKSQEIVLSAGASGAVFGIVGALLAAIALNRGRIEDMTTGKMVVFAVLSLYQGFASQGVDNTAHLGGFIIGFIVSAVCVLCSRKLRCNKESGLRDEG